MNSKNTFLFIFSFFMLFTCLIFYSSVKHIQDREASFHPSSRIYAPPTVSNAVPSEDFSSSQYDDNDNSKENENISPIKAGMIEDDVKSKYDKLHNINVDGNNDDNKMNLPPLNEEEQAKYDDQHNKPPPSTPSAINSPPPINNPHDSNKYPDSTNKGEDELNKPPMDDDEQSKYDDKHNRPPPSDENNTNQNNTGNIDNSNNNNNNTNTTIDNINNNNNNTDDQPIILYWTAVSGFMGKHMLVYSLFLFFVQLDKGIKKHLN